MAYFSLWGFGILFCILAALLLWKQSVALFECNKFRKQYMQTHPATEKRLFDTGWIWLDAVLAAAALLFAMQSLFTAGQSGYGPEIAVFTGFFLYCLSRAISQYNDGLMLFSKRECVLRDQSIPWSSIRQMEPVGSRFELITKKEKRLISRSQAQAIEQNLSLWKQSNRRR